MHKQHVYFLGLEHPTMTGLAVAIKQLGFAVSGVAIQPTEPLVDQLQQAGIHYFTSHNQQHLDPECLVVLAPHIAKSNLELKTAQRLKLEIVSIPQLIQQIAQQQHQITVIGSSTAATLLASCLQQTDYAADLICNQLVNTTNHWGEISAVHFGAKPWLVIDSHWQPASTLDNAAQWLYYQPQIIVLADKPDDKRPASFYKDLQHLFDHTKQLDNPVVEPTIILPDIDKQAIQLAKQAKLAYLTYGISKAADWRAEDIHLKLQTTTFKAKYQSKNLPIQSDMLGQQAVSDILATLAVSHLLKISHAHSLTAIGNCNGLYYDHHLYATVNDIHLVATNQPWSVDSLTYFNHFRQHFILDDNAKFWLIYDQSIDGKHFDLSMVDIVVAIDKSDLPTLKKSATPKLTYQLPATQAAHFMAQHLQPGDLACYLHRDGQPSTILHQLRASLQARSEKN